MYKMHGPRHHGSAAYGLSQKELQNKLLMGIGKLFPLVTTESSTRIGFKVCTNNLLLSDWDLLFPLVLTWVETGMCHYAPGFHRLRVHSKVVTFFHYNIVFSGDDPDIRARDPLAYAASRFDNQRYCGGQRVWPKVKMMFRAVACVYFLNPNWI
jgi:hypothetical protein